MKKVSILIPVYNELNSLPKILQKVESANFCNLDKEIILVDDCSTDGTKALLEDFGDKYEIFYHEKNQGKGAALRTAISRATGDIIVIQDADMEYNPEDYDKLINVILEDKADVVYGSRLLDSKNLEYFMPSSLFGNKVLTFLTNLLFNTSITDMETCYKAFRADLIKSINIKSKRFDFEPEITAKILKKQARLLELPISYNGRLYAAGKKITWKDGISAILALLKYRFTD
jgi:glycosyltransferase involved in cell wall biosynthesis